MSGKLNIRLAGQDATEAFYGLHRHEVLLRPQYARLQIGSIEGEESVLHSRELGKLSDVPYAEPTWLSAGYYSPYFKEVSFATRPLGPQHSETSNQSHRRLQAAMRKFADEIIIPDALVGAANRCRSGFSDK